MILSLIRITDKIKCVDFEFAKKEISQNNCSCPMIEKKGLQDIIDQYSTELKTIQSVVQSSANIDNTLYNNLTQPTKVVDQIFLQKVDLFNNYIANEYTSNEHMLKFSKLDNLINSQQWIQYFKCQLKYANENKIDLNKVVLKYRSLIYRYFQLILIKLHLEKFQNSHTVIDEKSVQYIIFLTLSYNIFRNFFETKELTDKDKHFLKGDWDFIKGLFKKDASGTVILFKEHTNLINKFISYLGPDVTLYEKLEIATILSLNYLLPFLLFKYEKETKNIIGLIQLNKIIIPYDNKLIYEQIWKAIESQISGCNNTLNSKKIPSEDEINSMLIEYPNFKTDKPTEINNSCLEWLEALELIRKLNELQQNNCALNPQIQQESVPKTDQFKEETLVNLKLQPEHLVNGQLQQEPLVNNQIQQESEPKTDQFKEETLVNLDQLQQELLGKTAQFNEESKSETDQLQQGIDNKNDSQAQENNQFNTFNPQAQENNQFNIFNPQAQKEFQAKMAELEIIFKKNQLNKSHEQDQEDEKQSQGSQDQFGDQFGDKLDGIDKKSQGSQQYEDEEFLRDINQQLQKNQAADNPNIQKLD